MANEEGITAGNIAKELGLSPAKVKKAIESLKLVPVAKKGACTYYSRDAVKKVQAVAK
jgi:predicted ArsR family transcriptional regulator